MTTLQEYDLEFKPTTIIKGQGLCNLMVEGWNNEDDDWENELELHIIDILSYLYRSRILVQRSGTLPSTRIFTRALEF